jgi:hypothetical protein
MVLLLVVALVLSGCIKVEAPPSDESFSPPLKDGQQEESSINGVDDSSMSVSTTTPSGLVPQGYKPTYDDFESGRWLTMTIIRNGVETLFFRKEATGLWGELDVNDYRVGVDMALMKDRQEELFAPMLIVNRITRTGQFGVLTTVAGETRGDIPLRRILHDGDVASVEFESFEMEAGMVTPRVMGEDVVAEAYHDGMLTISGLLPDTSRGLMTTYTPDTEFDVTVSVEYKAEQGYEVAPPEIVKWVTFDREFYIVEPDKYMPIWVYLNIPEGTEVPDRFMFWVKSTLFSGRQSAGVATAIAQAQAVRVHVIH